MKLFKRPPARSPRWWAFEVFVVFCALLIPFPSDSSHAGPAVVLTISALFLNTAPLLVRRIWPAWVFGWILLATCVIALVDVRLLSASGIFIALYTVAASGKGRRTPIVCAVILEIVVVVTALRTQGDSWFYASLFLTGLVLASVSLGLYRATRRAYLAELLDRASRLEREQTQTNELAVINERARISREMHDIVAHHLTVIVALSDAASLAAVKDPERAAEVMRTVAATGRQALDDTRQLLGVGGIGSPDDRSPLPDLDGLKDLIEGVRAAGLPVRYEIRGSPPRLPAVLELTIYRLVQEALTNTLKHGGAHARASVRLRYLPDVLHLNIEDDGAGALAPAPATLGRGLAGMRERATAFGGTVESGPNQPSGWRVSAQFQLEGLNS